MLDATWNIQTTETAETITLHIGFTTVGYKYRKNLVNIDSNLTLLLYQCFILHKDNKVDEIMRWQTKISIDVR